jgi:hypothetical protein
VAECGASVRVGEKAGRAVGWATSMRRGTPELKGRMRELAVAAKPETEFGSGVRGQMAGARGGSRGTNMSIPSRTA